MLIPASQTGMGDRNCNGDLSCGDEAKRLTGVGIREGMQTRAEVGRGFGKRPFVRGLVDKGSESTSLCGGLSRIRQVVRRKECVMCGTAKGWVTGLRGVGC